MPYFHAVMIDETGCEFGASVTRDTRAEALDALRDEYPESRVAQLETAEDTAAREQAIHDHILRGGDWDEEGRPFFHYNYDEEE